MAQKPVMRTHTDVELPLVVELQHVVDRVLVPNCIRRGQIFNLGMGALGLAIGAGCFFITRQVLTSAVFALIGAVMLTQGLLSYHTTARKTLRQMPKEVRSTDYVLEKESIWASNRMGDVHYPYTGCGHLVETQDNFYFVTRDGDAVVLEKGNLKGGSPEELRVWLTEKCGIPMVTLDPHWKIQNQV